LICKRHRRRLDDILTEIGELIVDTCRIVDGGAPQETSPKTRYVKAPAGPAPADLVILALYDRRTATTRLPGRPVRADRERAAHGGVVDAVRRRGAPAVG
jgi:hypothetical protein